MDCVFCRIVAGTAEHRVVAFLALNEIVAVVPEQEIVAGFAEDIVQAARAVDLVGVGLRGVRPDVEPHPAVHDVDAFELETLGLPIRVGVCAPERELMALYPQPRGRTPAVEYAPGPRELPGMPAGRRSPARSKG